MIKQLFFTAVLLVPGLAYAANPSADLSVQVIPAGPNNPPAPPAQATVANFNTCVICIDFTAPSGGVWVNGAQPAGVNAAQPNTWLDCGGASTPIFYHQVNTGPVFGPCPVIATDPGGTKTLKIQLGTTAIPANQNSFNGIDNGGAYPPPVTAIQLPTNSYTESTYWVSSWPNNGDNAHPPYSQGHWEGEFDGSPAPNAGYNWLEFDAFEVCCQPNAPGAYSSAIHGWYGGQSSGGSNWYGAYPPNASNFRPDQGYVKIGMRITSNGTNNLYKCMWVNDVFSNCISWAPSNAPGGYYAWQLSDTASRMRFLYSPVGVYNNPGAAQTLPRDMISWTKSINIWACTNWQTTACSTPSNANPGGY